MLWRRRRWRKLLNLIDHLPRNSAYVQAMSDDDTLADRMVEHQSNEDDDGVSSKPVRLMSEYSADVELLSSVNDRLAELIQTVAAVNGAKPRPIQYSPRPATALERARHRRRKAVARRIVARVLPHRAEKPFE